MIEKGFVTTNQPNGTSVVPVSPEFGAGRFRGLEHAEETTPRPPRSPGQAVGGVRAAAGCLGAVLSQVTPDRERAARGVRVSRSRECGGSCWKSPSSHERRRIISEEQDRRQSTSITSSLALQTAIYAYYHWQLQQAMYLLARILVSRRSYTQHFADRDHSPQRSLSAPSAAFSLSEICYLLL